MNTLDDLSQKLAKDQKARDAFLNDLKGMLSKHGVDLNDAKLKSVLEQHAKATDVVPPVGAPAEKMMILVSTHTALRM